MLEFYQAYTDYRGLMDLSAELLKQVALDATGSTEVEYQGQRLDFGRLERLSMREAIIRYWNDGVPPCEEQLRDPAWLSSHSAKTTPGEQLVDLYEQVAEAVSYNPRWFTISLSRSHRSRRTSPKSPRWSSVSRLSSRAWKSRTRTPSSTIRSSSGAALTGNSRCARTAMRRPTRWTSISSEP